MGFDAHVFTMRRHLTEELKAESCGLASGRRRLLRARDARKLLQTLANASGIALDACLRRASDGAAGLFLLLLNILQRRLRHGKMASVPEKVDLMAADWRGAKAFL